jgi:hypothetical protein
MDPNNNAALQTEVLRRRAGLGDSTSGIGAEVANAPEALNPLAAAGMTPPPVQTGGAMGNPTDGAMKAIKKEKGEARMLLDTMVWRLKDLAKKGQ